MKPQSVLVLEDLVLAAGGRALSLDLTPGEAYAVMGRAGSARSQFLPVLAKSARPLSGSVEYREPPAASRDREYARRHTPQGLAKRYGRRATSAQLTEVLNGLGLWEVRQTPVTHLEPGQVAACDLLPVFLSESEWALVDGQIDILDPWARESALTLIDQARAKGRAFIVSTNLVTVAQRMGSLVVFQGPSPVYAGPIADLLRASVPTELVVETDDPTTVGTMVEPFALSVRVNGQGVLVQADKGQELAARLLTMGYGRVKSVVVREPTLAEALRNLA